MNTQSLKIGKELKSATSFRYIEVVTAKHIGISQPALKLKLSNKTTEFNLFLQPSPEAQTYPKIDLSAMAQEVPGLAHIKFNRLQFSMQNTNDTTEVSDVALELLLQ